VWLSMVWLSMVWLSMVWLSMGWLSMVWFNMGVNVLAIFCVIVGVVVARVLEWEGLTRYCLTTLFGAVCTLVALAT
jgi:hypothetical protein